MNIQSGIEQLLFCLPNEGPYSQRAFGLFCVKRVVHLYPDSKVTECLDVVQRKVDDPDSVSNEELARAHSTVLLPPLLSGYARIEEPAYFVSLAALIVSLADPSLTTCEEYEAMFAADPASADAADDDIADVATASAYAVMCTGEQGRGTYVTGGIRDSMVLYCPCCSLEKHDHKTYMMDYNAEQCIQFTHLQSIVKHVAPQSIQLSIVPTPLTERPFVPIYMTRTII